MPTNASECSFVDALYRKYCDDGNVTLEVIELEQEHGRNRVLEYVGIPQLVEKYKNLSHLQFINLYNMNISSCGTTNHDKFCLHKARTIDVSVNKLSNWKTVAQIVRLTRMLSELILSSNPLLVPTQQEINEIGDAFYHLDKIVLGNLSYTWDDVYICAKLWPNIKELNLFNNNIVQISKVENILQNLTFLSLSGNPIKDWNEVCKLGIISGLETLELANCHVDSIYFHDSLKTALFPHLKYLDLTNNQINDWKSVAQLNKLNKLNYLLLKKNPIYDCNKYYFNFYFVISRISGLQKLDREPVTNEMRNDGEKYYLRTIYPEYLQKQTNPKLKEEFLQENPQFLELIEKLGEPVVAKKLTKEDKIKQNFLTLKISDPDNSDESKRSIQKQVPVATKVSNLKFILRRLLKIDMNQDFDLIACSKDYRETMQDRNDINIYFIDPDLTILVKRF